MSHPAFVFWSGGKDCCYALDRARAAGVDCRLLVTFIDEGTELVLAHRLPPELIEEQAALIGLPLLTVRMAFVTYERQLRNLLYELRSEGFARGVIGNSAQRDQRDWYEHLFVDFDLRPLFPLWGIPASPLLEQQIHTMESTIIQVDRRIDEQYLGRPLDGAFVQHLVESGLDGGDGGYHTFVRRAPVMDGEIVLTHAERRATPDTVSLEIDYWKVKSGGEE